VSTWPRGVAGAAALLSLATDTPTGPPPDRIRHIEHRRNVFSLALRQVERLAPDSDERTDHEVQDSLDRELVQQATIAVAM
jgi:hypothetical protein